MRCPLLDEMRRGLLEVVPRQALRLLSPEVAATMWDGELPSAGAMHGQCFVQYAPAGRGPAETVPLEMGSGAGGDDAAEAMLGFERRVSEDSAMGSVLSGRTGILMSEPQSTWQPSADGEMELRGADVSYKLDEEAVAVCQHTERLFWRALARLAASPASIGGETGKSGGTSWLSGLLCLWTGLGRLPVSSAQSSIADRMPDGGDDGGISHGDGAFGGQCKYADDDDDAAAAAAGDGGDGFADSMIHGVSSAGSGVVALAHSGMSPLAVPSSAVAPDKDSCWLRLRIEVQSESDPKRGARPLPRAQTCDRRLDMVAWPGETLEELEACLRIAIVNGSQGFAFM
jgi:hypothetical protein